MDSAPQPTGEVGRIGLYINLIFWAAICLGVLIQAKQMEGIGWQSLFWSTGLAGLLLTLTFMKYRVDPPTRKTHTAGVATILGLIAAYVVFFVARDPISVDLAEAAFEHFWPLFFGWTIANLAVATYFIATQPK